VLDNFEDDYFLFLEKKFSEVYQIAKEARSKGIDAVHEPESMIAKDLAERVEKSVGPPGIANRIRELIKIMPREEVAFKVAEEIASEIIGPDTEEKVAEQAIRTALSILDEGVTVSPIEGISRVKIRTNRDRTRYLAVYYAGPIRSAGGTDMGLSVIVADFVRKLMGIERYKATKEEAERFLEELRLYEREVARFQYKIPDSEILNAIARLHVEVSGVQTDFVEVTSFRNLARIETNGVRGGALRVVNDGLIGRAKKIVKIVDKLGIDGWDWLNELKFQTEDNAESKDLMFMEDVVAGRPIFSFPKTQGGFRLRYGRCRNTGLAAIGLNPITMHILRNFIASGTQLRIEKPGKAGVTLPVDYIEPPVVKLKEGSIVRVETLDLAHKIEGSIESILFLGDILIAAGEFIENNRHLIPSGFVEEWWSELLRKELMKMEDTSKISIDEEKLRDFIENPLKCIPNPSESLLLSKTFGIPNNIDHNDLISLREKFLSAEVVWEDENPVSIVINDGADIKHILDKLCLPHIINDGDINIDANFAPILYSCLALRDKEKIFEKRDTITEAISDLSGIKIYDKAPSFIGALRRLNKEK
jgi:DNA polymerase II large subunit